MVHKMKAALLELTYIAVMLRHSTNMIIFLPNQAAFFQILSYIGA